MSLFSILLHFCIGYTWANYIRILPECRHSDSQPKFGSPVHVASRSDSLTVSTKTAHHFSVFWAICRTGCKWTVPGSLKFYRFEPTRISRVGCRAGKGVCLIGRAELSGRSKCARSRHVTWWCSWSAVSKREKWQMVMADGHNRNLALNGNHNLSP